MLALLDGARGAADAGLSRGAPSGSRSPSSSARSRRRRSADLTVQDRPALARRCSHFLLALIVLARRSRRRARGARRSIAGTRQPLVPRELRRVGARRRGRGARARSSAATSRPPPARTRATARRRTGSGALQPAVYVHARATAGLRRALPVRPRLPRRAARALAAAVRARRSALLVPAARCRWALGETQYRTHLPWWLVLVHVGLAAAVWARLVALVDRSCGGRRPFRAAAARRLTRWPTSFESHAAARRCAARPDRRLPRLERRRPGASLAAGYLAKTWQAERFADIDPEDFFDFQVDAAARLARRRRDPADRLARDGLLPRAARRARPRRRAAARDRAEPPLADVHASSSIGLAKSSASSCGHARRAARRRSAHAAVARHRQRDRRRSSSSELGLSAVTLRGPDRDRRRAPRRLQARRASPPRASGRPCRTTSRSTPSPRAALALCERLGDAARRRRSTPTSSSRRRESYAEQVSEAVASDEDTAAYVEELERRVRRARRASTTCRQATRSRPS